ncbi:MAG: hypothetical protein A2Z81_05480 [Omnitrophica WOR_2 bacterium GWA2_45_18]|nr:MAG: hypothetical protein A2Z81_05480 [Omnitrophica WOR_2 bacterium GWA2_45_18]
MPIRDKINNQEFIIGKMNLRLIKQNFLLFLSSFLILFIELALIRWVSTEVRIFAYLSNLVLLSCFIGSGLGCYLSGQKPRLYVSLGMLALLIAFIKLPLVIHFQGQALHLFKGIPVFLAAFEDSVIHYQLTIARLRLFQAMGIASSCVLFFTILTIFIPLGQVMGRIWNEHPHTLQAYCVNIFASLLGVWAVSLCSFLFTPPWLWFLSGIVGLVLVISVMGEWSWKNILAVVLAGAAVLLMFRDDTDRAKHGLVVWTPYQKLNLYPLRPVPGPFDPYETRSPVGYEMNVNNVGFMNLLNLSDVFRDLFAVYFEKQPIYRGEATGFKNRFNFPYAIKKDARSALILGAGAGNDAAAALRNHLVEIDAVEIDPGIHQLGLRYHPEEPYQNPNVRVFVDDARSYVKRCKKKYDLITFGMLDAHALSSSMNNMRMDHYVYTRESFEDVRRLLNDEGVMVVTFWVQRVWTGQRIAKMIEEAFGWPPVVLSLSGSRNGLGPVAFITAQNKEVLASALNQDKELSLFILNQYLPYKGDVSITTDDWPYLYLRKARIPKMHLCVMAVIILVFVFGKRLFAPKGKPLNAHFFFLGSGFLLLEFQNINKTALLFGSTWMVNAVNISAILFLILLANLVVLRARLSDIRYPYAFLIGWLLLLWVVPLDIFNALGFWPRILASSIALNLPIFFAGMIFMISFQKTPDRDAAFGSNLMGAVAGGLLEHISFLTGIRSLILVTLVLYAVSLAVVPRPSR